MTPTQRLDALLTRIEPVSTAAADEAQRLLDMKTKPRGSLGRLEDLARQVCAIQDRTDPDVAVKAVIVMAADHGVAAEGVSAYPQEVTRQMLLNFAGEGAAINVLARQVGADVHVVDMGVASPVEVQGVRDERVGPGTQNMRVGPAMSRAQAIDGLLRGARVAADLCDAGAAVLGLGEMGIANTTASSALAAVFTGLDPEELTGRGTGIDDATRTHKIQVIRDALAINEIDRSDPISALAAVGGFEIAGLAGAVLEGAARRTVMMVDGFISSAAALVAVRLQPAVAEYLVMSHKSVEAGHRVVLREIGARPLLDLDMRLGEGTGAALAMGMVDAAVAVLRDMASFQSAGVTDTGR